MWYRFAVAPRLLSNPIVSGFWVNEKEINELGEIVNKPRFIDYGEEINVRGWQSLLSNKSKINADQDSLNKFLSDDKFEIIKGKKFYVPGLSGYEPTLLKNPIKGGFWVYEKKKNELGEIVSKPLEIPYEKPLSIRDWLRLLNTSGKFINAKNINCLKEFLTDDKFEIIDGKKFYRPTSRGNPVLIRNPIDETFYIDDEPIEPSAKMNQSTWVKLLKSEIIYDNPALLKDFIINNLKRNDDGKLIYTYDPSIRSIMLQNPIAEGFYIGNDFYGPDTTMGVGAWNKLLNTGQINSNDPDSLKDFLSDKRRFRTRNNKKTYIPVKRSIREGLFSEKFYDYHHDDITV